MSDNLTINDVKVALSEVLKDNEHVELTVLKALNKYDTRLKEDIKVMCEQNVDAAINSHQLGCKGKPDKKPYYLILSVVLERIADKLGIT